MQARTLLFLFLFPAVSFAHGLAEVPAEPDRQRLIEFPDTDSHLTLAVDLHTHSVFSDGRVWPRVRVEEALRDGLDAIAITEHIEWQPHRADIPHVDRNRAWEIARDAATETDLIVINGSEITRDMPAGHINAVFLDDANALLFEPEGTEGIIDAVDYANIVTQTSPETALKAARDQAAFTFWNHPAWTEQTPDGIAELTGFHIDAIRHGDLHGIEVVNGAFISEEAFQIALDHDLAILGVSDIHGLIDWDYEPHNGGHRPVTLVFAEERTEAAIRDALFDRRTVVWFRNQLLGRPRDLAPLLAASLVAEPAAYRGEGSIASVRLINRSDMHFRLENLTSFTFEHHGESVEVPPHDSVELAVRTQAKLSEIRLEFRVRNALFAPRKPATLVLTIPAVSVTEHRE